MSILGNARGGEEGKQICNGKPNDNELKVARRVFNVF